MSLEKGPAALGEKVGWKEAALPVQNSMACMGLIVPFSGEKKPVVIKNQEEQRGFRGEKKRNIETSKPNLLSEHGEQLC